MFLDPKPQTRKHQYLGDQIDVRGQPDAYELLHCSLGSAGWDSLKIRVKVTAGFGPTIA